jgi:hypothetical protein
MATCATCGTTILFGGVKVGDYRFCNEGCRERGGMINAAAALPDDIVADFARQIHAGPCPNCGRAGPVDVHAAYWVWSALAFTRWGNLQQVSCRRCALKTQAGRLVSSSVLGWWGLPWGFVMTPIQVGRTALAMIAPPGRKGPSAQLHQIARAHLASQPRAGAGNAGPGRRQWSL